MQFSKKINSVRSESLDTGHMSFPQSSSRSSISNPEDQDKVFSSDLGKTFKSHKKVVSFSCITSELLYGDSFEITSISPSTSASLSLKNLSKLIKLKLLSKFNKWKSNQVPNKAQKLFTMISKLHQLFSKRGKRVFHPPRIIKDADEIMKRTIKKIIQIKQRLLETAFIRWKFFKLALYTKEKAVVFFKACQLAGHLFKDAFFKWKLKVLALEAVKRTAATEKTVRVLNKAFRGRFKLFVFQTYLKIGPKKAGMLFSALLLKKAQENKRLALKGFYCFLRVARKKSAQRRADRKVFKMVAVWDKVVKGMMRKGWKKMRPGRLDFACRVVFRRVFMKRNWFWQWFKEMIWRKNCKSKIFKMQNVLMRVTRKRQKVGFRVFEKKKFNLGNFFVFHNVFKNVVKGAFFDIKMFITSAQVDEIKEATKFIRKNHRKNVLRSVKLTGKTMNCSLKNLIKRKFQKIIQASHTRRSQLLSLKLATKYLVKGQKSIFYQWKTFTFNQSKKKIKSALNGQKIQVILLKVLRRTLKNSCFLLFERKAQVITATRVVTRHLGKKPKLVLTRWQKNIESINQGLLFDACRSQKLKEKLLKVIRASLKSSFSRIFLNTSKFLPSLRNIFKISQNRMKNYLKIWALASKDSKTTKIMISSKAVALKNSLTSLLSLKYSKIFSNLLKNKKKSTKTLRRLFFTFSKNLSKVLKIWKNFSFLSKKNSGIYKVYLKLLQKNLKKIIHRNLKIYFKSFFSQCQSKLVRILGVYLFRLQDVPRKVFNVWRFFVLACKTKLMLDNKRCEKIRQKLKKIVQISLRSSFFRVLGNGRLVKGYFFRMNCLFSNRFRRVFEKWKVFSYLCANFKLLDAFRRQQLKMVLGSLVSRVTFSAFHRIKGAGNMIKSIFRSMIAANELKLKNSFKQWKSFSDLIRYKSCLMFRLVSDKLRSRLEHLLQLRLSGYFSLLHSRSELKVKNSFRAFFRIFYLFIRKSFLIWKRNSERDIKKQFQRQTGGMKLVFFMRNLEIKRNFEFFNRVFYAHRKIVEKMNRWIFNGVRNVLIIWKKNGKKLNMRKIIREKKGLKFQIVLKSFLDKRIKNVLQIITSTIFEKNIIKLAIKTHTSNLRNTLNRWKFLTLLRYQHDQNFLLKNKFSAVILQKVLTKVLKFRVTQVLKERIFRPSKVFEVLKNLDFSLCKTLRSRFYYWSRKVPTLHLKTIRSRKLQTFLKNSLLKSNENTFTTLLLSSKTFSLLEFLKSLKSSKISPASSHKKAKQAMNSKVLLKFLLGLCLRSSLSSILTKKSHNFFYSIQKASKNASPIRKFFLLWLNHYKKTLFSGFSRWSLFIQLCQKGDLLDSSRCLNLRHHLEKLSKRLTRDAFNRMIGQGNKIKGHMKSFAFHIQKSLSFGFAAWKTWIFSQKLAEVWLRFRGTSLRTFSKKIMSRYLKSTLERIIGNGKRVFGQMMRFLSHFKYKYLLCFNSWKEKVMKLKQRDSFRVSKILMFFSNISKRVVKDVLEVITGDTKIRKAIKKLVFSLKTVQKHVLQVLWSRVEKLKTIKKINSSFLILKHIQIQLKKTLISRFSFWKNMEFLRRRRILRKSIGKMIQNMSINFESGFWKWKFVLTRCGKQLNPRHSIFFKRISAIASSYQTRLEQFSLFKLVLNYKTHQLNHRVTLPKAIAQLIKDSESDRSDPRPIQSRDPNMPEENLFRLGALEILFLRLECAKLRRFSWVLSAIYSNFRHFDCFEQERKNFKEKIAEIRYERQSLLEDNNTLRLHNDNLISSLEKNTEDLQEISLTMDYLKINSMVKAIERVFDYNLLTSFYKLNQKVD